MELDVLFHLPLWVLLEWVSESHSVVPDSLQPNGLCSPWNPLGHSTGVGSLSLLQGIFPTQRLNPGLPHCRQILYQLSHNRSPRILEWVAYPFSLDHSNPGMESGSPDCRQVLYQLSYQGSSCGDGNTLIDCIDVNIVVLKLSFSFVRCFLWGKMDKGLMESLYYFL